MLSGVYCFVLNFVPTLMLFLIVKENLFIHCSMYYLRGIFVYIFPTEPKAFCTLTFLFYKQIFFLVNTFLKLKKQTFVTIYRLNDIFLEQKQLKFKVYYKDK